MTVKFADLNKGDAIPELKKDPITHLQLVRYAGASGDFNPIHHDEKFAKEQGLDGTIAHGMLVMGMIGQLVSNWVGVAPVKTLKVAFKAMTKPGETIICKGTVKRLKETEEGEKLVTLAVSAENSEGETKVSGEAVVALD